MHRFIMSSRFRQLFKLALALVTTSAVCAPLPPPPAREFRGTWIATVHCINWPSEPGLPAATQKEQMIKLLD